MYARRRNYLECVGWCQYFLIILSDYFQLVLDPNDPESAAVEVEAKKKFFKEFFKTATYWK